MDKIECPVCGKYFTKSVINAHVNTCLLNNDGDNKQETVSVSPPRKITRLDSDAQSSHPSSIHTRQSARVPVTAEPAEDSPPKTKDLSSNVLSSKKQTGQSLNCGDSKAPARVTQNAFDVLRSRGANPTRSPTQPSKSPLKRSHEHAFSEEVPDSGKETHPQSFKDGKRPSTETSTSPESEFAACSKSNATHSGFRGNHPTQHAQTFSKSSGQKGKDRHVPLADRMRPLTLDGYVGQEHVIGRNKMLRKLLISHTIPSMILWGPPGCGKTTLAKIIAARSKEVEDTRFVTLSATTSGVADVKETVKIAKNELKLFKRKTILFVDEIHRFNKLQQDTFLPHVEDGTIILIGATTENPSFQVNNALMSRCKVIVLEKLSVDQVTSILERAVTKLGLEIVSTAENQQKSNSHTTSPEPQMSREALTCLANHCDGDARMALNSLQTAFDAKTKGGSDLADSDGIGCVVTVEDIKDGLLRSHVQYDRTGEEHYNCASALQKSIRGSDDGGALYWMTRMLEGGEDPLFIARRLVVCASEDIGLADAQALPLAVACFQACQFIGRAECGINLAHCVTYLARAPKSNEAYAALTRVREQIRSHEGPLPGVPLHLRNASTKLMKDLGYGAGYKYSHTSRDPQNYLPPELGRVDFFKDQ